MYQRSLFQRALMAPRMSDTVGEGLAARVREELKAIGARPRREWLTGLAALSRRELRIVQLAAEGKTNREIAY